PPLPRSTLFPYTTLFRSASPETIARAAQQLGCRSVAFTYNDPVIFMEYAIDVAQACHDLGIKAVSVTAGYMCDEPRRELYKYMEDRKSTRLNSSHVAISY